MEILDWIKVSDSIKANLAAYIKKGDYSDKYVALFLLWDDDPSKVYVSLKKQFWADIWLNVEVFGSEDKSTNVDYLERYKYVDYTDIKNVYNTLDFLNKDNDCLGIVVQLPLPDYFMQYKSDILSKISPLKDIDGLGWLLLWLSAIDLIDFTPATPASVLNILEYYDLADFKWKNVTIIWQSNLVWKPLAMEIIKRGWTVYSFNAHSDIEQVKESARKSDYIMSATGMVEIVDDTFLKDDCSQVLVDIWWWLKDGKAVWDVNYEAVKDKVYAITPVPGGVWPVTVASLFSNIIVIERQSELIDSAMNNYCVYFK